MKPLYDVIPRLTDMVRGVELVAVSPDHLPAIYRYYNREPVGSDVLDVQSQRLMAAVKGLRLAQQKVSMALVHLALGRTP